MSAPTGHQADPGGNNMTLNELLSEFQGTSIEDNCTNYINIKCNLLTPNEENAKKFNKILSYLQENVSCRVKRTKSGGISKTKYIRIPSYDYTYGRSGAELLVFAECGAYRIQFRPKLADNEETNKAMSGRKAFNEFKKILSENGINLDDYAVENGLEIKQEIEKPLIKLERSLYASTSTQSGFEGCHHIDFHNSYPGGLAATHPEFKPVIEMMYEKRKENPVYKAILNYSVGFMQSKWCGYRYATLSRDAINNNNARVRALAEELRTSGRVILAYNTDGIWYSGDIYHGAGEGPELGQWHNDHTDCTIRFKSAGAYEYIEDGQYHPVVRGYTRLDQIKSRENWAWGDIYQADILVFAMNEDGIYVR